MSAFCPCTRNNKPQELPSGSAWGLVLLGSVGCLVLVTIGFRMAFKRSGVSLKTPSGLRIAAINAAF